MAEKTCAWCGKTFEPKTGKFIYCSEECSHQARRKASREWNAKKRGQRAPVVRYCGHCGKKFEPRDMRQFFCSADCRLEAYRAVARENYHKNHVPKTSIYTCGICEKTFESKRLAKYCPECKEIARERTAKAAYERQKEKARKEREKRDAEQAKKTRLRTCQQNKRCQSCKYLFNYGGGPLICDYIEQKGKPRVEPVSEHCTKYEPRKGARRK